MNIIFKKSQLKLVEDINTDNKPALSVVNSENDNNVDSLQQDYDSVQQQNTNNNPVEIQTQGYTNKTIAPSNANQTMTIPKDASSINQAMRMITTSNPVDMPGKIRIEGKNRKKNLKEGIAFSKKELDNFLKSL